MDGVSAHEVLARKIQDCNELAQKLATGLTSKGEQVSLRAVGLVLIMSQFLADAVF